MCCWLTCCLLLIACLNVANLLVARACARRKELAIRTALGGGRLRLVRERLMESLLLSSAGGALGLLLAFTALHWLTRTRHDMSRIELVTDGAAVGSSVSDSGVLVLSALFSGLVATFGTSDKRILGALHEASRSVSGGSVQATLRKVLLALEFGLTVVLLLGAGLLLKSYERLRSADMGCTTQNVITMHLGLPDARYATPALRANFYDTLLDRLRALPGVDAAGFVTAVPGQGYGMDWTFRIVEHPLLPQGSGLFALKPLGRSEVLRRHGALLFFVGVHLTGSDWMRRMDHHQPIVRQAVLSGARTRWASTSTYAGKMPSSWGLSAIPAMQSASRPGRCLVLRVRCRYRERRHACDSLVSHDLEQFALPVQRIVSEIEQRSAHLRRAHYEPFVSGKSTLDQSFNATLLVAFATLSLVLAAVGLFGVMSYMAAQRTTEIGIRIALGAKREQTLRKMLQDEMRPAIFGLVVGLAASLEAGRLMRDLLYEISPLDPAVYAAVAATLLAVAGFACLLPAWRASRLDPMQALRAE